MYQHHDNTEYPRESRARQVAPSIAGNSGIRLPGLFDEAFWAVLSGSPDFSENLL
jgi:hypothetical protein